jgi:DNA polymerase III sliding clamp (beta) subunit (PCNA family)
MNEHAIEVTVSDLECTARLQSGSFTEGYTGTISYCARAQDLLNLLDMPAGDGSIYLENVGDYYSINGMKIETVSSDEYPTVWREMSPLAGNIHPADFCLGVETVRDAASKDETRFNMTGIHIKGDIKGLTFETTDGHRAHTIQTGRCDSAVDVIMPINGLPYYNLMAGTADSVLVDKERIEIRSECADHLIGYTLDTQIRNIDGEFPPLAQVIERIGATTAKCTLPAKMKEKITELKAVIKALPKKSNAGNMSLMVEPGLVVVTAMLDGGATRRIELPAKTTNGKGLVGLKAAYFVQALETARGADIEIQLHGDLNGVFFDSELPNGASTRAIVMPCRL